MSTVVQSVQGSGVELAAEHRPVKQPSAVPGSHVRPKELMLTPEDLTERLRLNSPQLVEELYQIALRQIQNETARQTRLDAKATSFLTAVGVSLTVSLIFGAQILLAKWNELQAAIGPTRCGIIVVLFSLAVMAGLIAGCFAIAALRVRGSYGTMDEGTVFNTDELRAADQLEGNPGVAQYRRYLIVELWQIAQKHFAVHQHKAVTIRRGQLAFAGFMMMLVAICMVFLTSLPARFL